MGHTSVVEHVSWLPAGGGEIFAFFLRTGEIFVAFTPGEIGEISHPNYRPTSGLCVKHEGFLNAVSFCSLLLAIGGINSVPHAGMPPGAAARAGAAVAEGTVGGRASDAADAVRSQL